VASIVGTAWELARAHGIAGLSLHALAREVGIRQPSLYAYFDSKNALYDAMFADGNRQLLERVDGLKNRLLQHPEVRAAVGEAGGTLRRLLLEAVDDPTSELRVRVAGGLATFGQRLVDDAELAGKVNGWAEDVVAHVTTNYSAELTTVITDTVERWDGVETARKIELQVGSDLQFIRINGTVVGALAGLVIQAVTQVIS